MVSSLFAYTADLTSFNTGKVSSYMESRSDFPKYPSFCRILENMLVLSQGPVTRRPGTKYIATAKQSGAILIPFEYSVDDTYMIEAGNYYMRFYRNGGQILDPCDTNNPYEITTPFDTNELQNIRFAQSNNVMYLVDGNDEPQKLTRTAHTNWTIADINVTTGPFRPLDTSDTNILPSGITGNITLMADKSIWFSGHVGALWAINQNMTSSTLTGTLDSNESSLESVYFKGGYSFVTSGNSGGTITLERSTNGGITWSAALTPLTNTDFDNPSEEEVDGAIYRVTMSNYASGTPTYTLTIANQQNYGIVKITAYIDANEVNAVVLADLSDANTTKAWREGYWSDYRGWPKTVTFHQQRLCFGGSETFPQTIWFGKSNPDDVTNFTEGTADDSSFAMALPGQNPIQWLLSQDYMFVGTSGSIGKYGKEGEAITPTTPSFTEQSKNGSENISAVFAGDSVLYTERGGRRIREFAYSLQYNKFMSDDVTVLSSDILEDGVKDVAFQFRPNPILWCVLNDGNMATLTLLRNQEIISWSTQITDGNFISVATLPSSTGEDEVWTIVERSVDSNIVYYVEQFQPMNWGTDVNDCWFVDCGSSYDSAATDTFGGMSYLEGKTITSYADGIVCPDVVVTDGNITIANLSSRVISGLSFTSKLEIMPITIDPRDKGMNKKITSIDFDFYQTGYCEYRAGKSGTLIPCNFWNPATFTQAKQPLYTSEDSYYNVRFPYGSKKKATIYIQSDKPQPLTIRAILPEFEVSK